MTRDAKQAVRQEAIDRLKQWIKPGDTLYTQIKHVSRSGMQRVIQVVKIDCPDKYRIDEGKTEPDILYLGYNVATVVDMRYDREREGVKVGGCGMDTGFHLVYELSHALFRDGFDCVGEGCPANDHSNGDRDYTPHRHSDPGYALKQRWL
jgi:hypothetical protein